MRPNALLLLATAAMLAATSVGSAAAQGLRFNAASFQHSDHTSPHMRAGTPRSDGPIHVQHGHPENRKVQAWRGHHDSGRRKVVHGRIVVIYDDKQLVDDGASRAHHVRQAPRRAARRRPSSAQASNPHQVPDQMLVEVANGTSPQALGAFERRHRLTRLETQSLRLTGTTLIRWRIPDRRSVTTVLRQIEHDSIVAWAQPNYLFALQQDKTQTRRADASPQYQLAKLHLPQAHAIATGDTIRVAVINSGIDALHPELADSVAGRFNALGSPAQADKHGTAVASLIAAHGKLTGAAPRARILAIRAFKPAGASAQGTTFNILKGIDWAATHGARVINMSFAGPQDAVIHRGLQAAHRQGIVLIAAAGNAGAKSPPLYPAADENVIAVTATDDADKLFPLSNRGRYITIAAPGSQLLVAAPHDTYQISSGTSYAAAEVSGIAALMLQRRRDLNPDKLRDILMATASDLGPRGRDSLFGAGLADAYRALMAEGASLAAAGQPAHAATRDNR